MIIGERVRLRALERADLPFFVVWLNDPEVTENLVVDIPLSLAQEENWFNSITAGPREEQPLAIEIRGDSGWVFIGDVSLFNINWINRSAELGILIGEKTCWSRGYGREAIELMLRHGFEHLNLNRIYLRVYDSNPRGIRCYEHAGFVHEGRMRQGVYKNGAYRDVLMMAVLRSEWHPKPKE